MGTTVCLQNSYCIIYEELIEQTVMTCLLSLSTGTIVIPVHWYNSWSCFTIYISLQCVVRNQTLDLSQTFMRHDVIHEISENLHLMDITHFYMQ